MLKWFSLSCELQRVVPVLGARPSNVAQFHNADGRFKNHIAIASLNGMILILDANDRVVSAVGGETPRYTDGKLETLQYSITRSIIRTMFMWIRLGRFMCRNGGQIKLIR